MLSLDRVSKVYPNGVHALDGISLGVEPGDLQDHMLTLWADLGPTLVVVTHDVDESVVLADRILVMCPRPGRIFAEVEADLPRPRDRQSAAFDFVKRRVLAALDRSLERTAVIDDRETRATAGAALWW
jgi:sulfonate transport system ATP-binding protein